MLLKCFTINTLSCYKVDDFIGVSLFRDRKRLKQKTET